jgi:hypothetical protein
MMSDVQRYKMGGEKGVLTDQDIERSSPWLRLQERTNDADASGGFRNDLDDMLQSGQLSFEEYESELKQESAKEGRDKSQEPPKRKYHIETKRVKNPNVPGGHSWSIKQVFED